MTGADENGPAADHFASAATALGYARDRPPVHAALAGRLRAALPARPVDVALDVGCGAGASTAPLLALARTVTGLDPWPAMVAAARTAVPAAGFVVGAAERLPVADGTVDLITAAGALDHVDLAAFGPDAERALRTDGRVLVYDFARGRRLARASGGDPLDRWYDRFLARCGRPARPTVLRPRLAAVPGLRLLADDDVTVDLPLTRAAYVAYVMTDAGDPSDADLRAWCDRTLAPVLGDGASIAFSAYVATLVPATAGRSRST